MMRLIKRMRGQSTAEYAVLFAIVIGAAIAMQQYVKSRLQGAVKAAADGYQTAVGSSSSSLTAAPFEPDRTTTSQSSGDIDMTSARSGTVASSSKSDTTVTKEGSTGGPGPGPGPGGPGPGPGGPGPGPTGF